MNLRAVICDVYGTLLELTPPPPDRERRWQKLWEETWHQPARMSCAEFFQQTGQLVARQQRRARRRGIRHPEIYWPEVVRTVVPEVAKRDPARCARWQWEQVKLSHSVRLFPRAVPVLKEWIRKGVRLGLASNAQPYTVRELREALAAEGLGLEIFDPNLTFWSYAHGFSKPDPHVFRILTLRLAACGIPVDTVLMVGDRHDNDVAPARAQGWRAWQLRREPDPKNAWVGDWDALGQAQWDENTGYASTRAPRRKVRARG